MAQENKKPLSERITDVFREAGKLADKAGAAMFPGAKKLGEQLARGRQEPARVRKPVRR